MKKIIYIRLTNIIFIYISNKLFVFVYIYFLLKKINLKNYIKESELLFIIFFNTQKNEKKIKQ